LHGCMTYLLQSDEGQIATAHSISAGLDYPGVGPEHAYYKDSGRFEFVSITDEEALEGFQALARVAGILPALASDPAAAYAVPLADGPVIQRAAQRALAGGTSMIRVFELVKSLRADVRAPIVLLTYYNPVLQFGLPAFAETAAKVGVDGVIVADLPPEEAAPLATEAARAGLDVIHLVAPTSTRDRLRVIARASRGFVYLVSITGVTVG